MNPYLEHDQNLQYLVQVVKARKDPFIVSSAYSNCPVMEHGILHEIADLHDKLDYNDFVFLGQALSPGDYLAVLTDLSTDGKWIGEGIYGDADDQIAIGNIQGFLKRAETWKGDESTNQVDSGLALSGGHLLRLMASLDQDAERQAHHYYQMEEALDSVPSDQKRFSYLKTILKVTQYIESSANDDDPCVLNWLKFIHS